MWVIANGAPKSGSTWIFQLIKGTRQFSKLPEGFQDQAWRNQSVGRTRLKEAVRFLPAQDSHFATKQHWPSPGPLFRNEAEANRLLLRTYRLIRGRMLRAQQDEIGDLLLTTPGLKICNIIRDVRDVMVSLYHHQVRRSLFEGDIESFLRCNSASVIRSTVAYHRYWMSSPHRTRDNYFVTTYEYLSADTPGAAGALFDFLGLKLSDKAKAAAVEGSRFDSKRSKGPGKFYRKGQALSFADDLTEAQSADILKAATHYGLGDVKRAIAAFDPSLEPYLASTDVGLAPSG